MSDLKIQMNFICCMLYSVAFSHLSGLNNSVFTSLGNHFKIFIAIVYTPFLLYLIMLKNYTKYFSVSGGTFYNCLCLLCFSDVFVDWKQNVNEVTVRLRCGEGLQKIEDISTTFTDTHCHVCFPGKTS